MTAVPDADTVINMVHHSYYNLAGHGSGDVLGQLLRLPADAYVPVDGELMPTGEVLRVAGPYDFRELRPIGAHLDRLPPVGGQVFPGGGGYDHNWCLRGLPGDPGQPGGLVPAAEAVDPASGRRLRLWSTEPGVQMYTGGYLDDTIVGKGGMRYCRYAGFTLETQKFPDSPNIAWFPPALVEAGATYRHEMLLDLAPAE
jgi:aldose 1-epimerase